MRPPPGLGSVLSLLLLNLISVQLHAQADVTASKNATLSGFAGYSYVATNRNLGYSEDSVNHGVTFGGGFTAYLPGGFLPSLEARLKFAPGENISENTYGGGFRVQHNLWRVEPYGAYFISYGTVRFPLVRSPNYTFDNSVVYAPGAGVDIPITYKWIIRAEYQYEFWHTGRGIAFNPQILTFGVRYRIPFRPYLRR